MGTPGWTEEAVHGLGEAEKTAVGLAGVMVGQPEVPAEIVGQIEMAEGVAAESGLH